MKHLFYTVLLVFTFVSCNDPLTGELENEPSVTDTPAQGPTSKTLNPQAPGNGNPIVPGYFADPSIVKFGDMYYIYATTDGYSYTGGPPGAWYSSDLVNWKFRKFEIDYVDPALDYWAPEAIYNATTGKYHLYYAKSAFGGQWVATSDTPLGPWNEIRKIESSIDGQIFFDGADAYFFWGSGTSAGNGTLLVKKLNPDLLSLDDSTLKTITPPEYTEGPFMFKRGDYYYLLWSGGWLAEPTYNVRYSRSTDPVNFDYTNNTRYILRSNQSRGIIAPGHCSVLEHKGKYYIFYHRHNEGGTNRQLAVDELTFDAQGNINEITPTHTGFGVTPGNLLYQKPVSTNAAHWDANYTLDHVVDNNFGTRNAFGGPYGPITVTVDMESVQQIRETHLAFLFLTRNYQYKIEYSINNTDWQTFTDHTAEGKVGFMVDNLASPVSARYLKLTITGFEGGSEWSGLWEFKAFSEPVFGQTPNVGGGDPPPGGGGSPSTPVNGTLVSQGKTATASTSYFNGDYNPEKAFDGSTSTRWAASDGSKPQWLTVDLGKSYNITSVETAFEYAANAYQYLIEVSEDNSTWTTFVDKTGNTVAGNPIYVDTGAAVGRYVRLSTTGTQNSWDFASISEMEVYAD